MVGPIANDITLSGFAGEHAWSCTPCQKLVAWEILGLGVELVFSILLNGDAVKLSSIYVYNHRFRLLSTQRSLFCCEEESMKICITGQSA